MGFGFRGTIPKLPSFKVINKVADFSNKPHENIHNFQRKPTVSSQLSKRRTPKRSDSMSTDEDSSRKSKSGKITHRAKM